MNGYERSKEVEAELIKENKCSIDKRSKYGNTLILDKKCKRCNSIHPLVKYTWHLSRADAYPSLLIQIPCIDDNTFKETCKAQSALSNIGIHFDTGYGGLRDWEFDWSLSGEHFISKGCCENIKIDRNRRDWSYDIRYILRKLIWKIFMRLC